MFNICYVWDYVFVDRVEVSNVYICVKFYDLGVFMWGIYSGGIIVCLYVKIFYKWGVG